MKLFMTRALPPPPRSRFGVLIRRAASAEGWGLPPGLCLLPLVAQDLAGMDRAHGTLDQFILGHDQFPLMVVHDFDVVGVAPVPTKAYPPLLVDADAELS